MKKVERDRAIRLRKDGQSIKEIARILNVAKSSVSYWVRDVQLTAMQRSQLTARGFSKDAIEKRRLARIQETQKKHSAIMKEAGDTLQYLSSRDLWLLGTALYWGEGGKTNRGSARVANSDPAVIKLMMRFFREICKVPEEKFRGHVHTFSHLNKNAAEKYWSEVSDIPREQFFKTYTKPSIASKHKKDSLPYGTFQIYVNDTKLFLTIMGWIEKTKDLT